jgi:hypothetical protein
MNEKSIYTTSNEPQKVVFAYNRPSLRKIAPLLSKILDPPLQDR